MRMTRSSGSMDHWGLPSPLLVLGSLCLLVSYVSSAPLEEVGSWETDLEKYLSEGCYYQYKHYNEGEQIITNEPCLNCTCHNQVLMCYLRVCPFIKPVGQNCIIEKTEDQCCPTITCPQVPVELWTSTTLPPPMIDTDGSTSISDSSSDVALMTPGQGCQIDGRNYMDGMQIPRDPHNPCELCYCIRNHTACVMQECRLNVKGCQPIMREGVCCPVKYICEEGLVLPHDLPASSFTTSSTPRLPSTGCMKNGTFYEHGASIESSDPCQHCYCMQNEVVCAVEPCMGPLEGKTDNCVPQPPSPGECCPSEYKCTQNNITIDSILKPDSGSPSSNISLGCMYRNESYENLSDVPMEDPCDLCQCVEGKIICAQMDCAQPPNESLNCTRAPPKEGECCPNYTCKEESHDANNTTTTSTTASPLEYDDSLNEIAEDDYDDGSTIGLSIDESTETRPLGENEVSEGDRNGQDLQKPDGGILVDHLAPTALPVSGSTTDKPQMDEPLKTEENTSMEDEVLTTDLSKDEEESKMESKEPVMEAVKEEENDETASTEGSITFEEDRKEESSNEKEGSKPQGLASMEEFESVVDEMKGMLDSESKNNGTSQKKEDSLATTLSPVEDALSGSSKLPQTSTTIAPITSSSSQEKDTPFVNPAILFDDYELEEDNNGPSTTTRLSVLYDVPTTTASPAGEKNDASPTTVSPLDETHSSTKSTSSISTEDTSFSTDASIVSSSEGNEVPSTTTGDVGEFPSITESSQANEDGQEEELEAVETTPKTDKVKDETLLASTDKAPSVESTTIDIPIDEGVVTTIGFKPESMEGESSTEEPTNGDDTVPSTTLEPIELDIDESSSTSSSQLSSESPSTVSQTDINEVSVTTTGSIIGEDNIGIIIPDAVSQTDEVPTTSEESPVSGSNKDETFPTNSSSQSSDVPTSTFEPISESDNVKTTTPASEIFGAEVATTTAGTLDGLDNLATASPDSQTNEGSITTVESIIQDDDESDDSDSQTDEIQNVTTESISGLDNVESSTSDSHSQTNEIPTTSTVSGLDNVESSSQDSDSKTDDVPVTTSGPVSGLDNVVTSFPQTESQTDDVSATTIEPITGIDNVESSSQDTNSQIDDAQVTTMGSISGVNSQGSDSQIDDIPTTTLGPISEQGNVQSSSQDSNSQIDDVQATTLGPISGQDNAESSSQDSNSQIDDVQATTFGPISGQDNAESSFQDSNSQMDDVQATTFGPISGQDNAESSSQDSNSQMDDVQATTFGAISGQDNAESSSQDSNSKTDESIIPTTPKSEASTNENNVTATPMIASGETQPSTVESEKPSDEAISSTNSSINNDTSDETQTTTNETMKELNTSTEKDVVTTSVPDVNDPSTISTDVPNNVVSGILDDDDSDTFTTESSTVTELESTTTTDTEAGKPTSTEFIDMGGLTTLEDNTSSSMPTSSQESTEDNLLSTTEAAFTPESMQKDEPLQGMSHLNAIETQNESGNDGSIEKETEETKTEFEAVVQDEEKDDVETASTPSPVSTTSSSETQSPLATDSNAIVFPTSVDDALNITEVIPKQEDQAPNVSIIDMFSTFAPPDDEDSNSTDIQFDDDEIIGSTNTSVQSTCLHKGVTYLDFDDIPSEDPCETCYCNYGQSVCSKMICNKLEGHEFCRPIPPKDGKCCPDQFECLALTEDHMANVTFPSSTSSPLDPSGKCDRNGSVYENGESLPIENKCYNSCTCINTEIVCDYLPCKSAPELPGLSCVEVPVEDECCPMFKCDSLHLNETSTTLPSQGSTNDSSTLSPSKDMAEPMTTTFKSLDESQTNESSSDSTGASATTSSSLENDTSESHVSTTSGPSEDKETTLPGLVESTVPSSEKVETTKPSSEQVETTDPSSEQVETTEPTSEKVETTEPTSEKVETTEPTSEKVETTEPTSEKVETTDSSEKMETTTMSEETKVTDGKTELTTESSDNGITLSGIQGDIAGENVTEASTKPDAPSTESSDAITPSNISTVNISSTDQPESSTLNDSIEATTNSSVETSTNDEATTQKMIEEDNSTIGTNSDSEGTSAIANETTEKTNVSTSAVKDEEKEVQESSTVVPEGTTSTDGVTLLPHEISSSPLDTTTKVQTTLAPTSENTSKNNVDENVTLTTRNSQQETTETTTFPSEYLPPSTASPSTDVKEETRTDPPVFSLPSVDGNGTVDSHSELTTESSPANDSSSPSVDQIQTTTISSADTSTSPSEGNETEITTEKQSAVDMNESESSSTTQVSGVNDASTSPSEGNETEITTEKQSAVNMNESESSSTTQVSAVNDASTSPSEGNETEITTEKQSAVDMNESESSSTTKVNETADEGTTPSGNQSSAKEDEVNTTILSTSVISETIPKEEDSSNSSLHGTSNSSSLGEEGVTSLPQEESSPEAMKVIDENSTHEPQNETLSGIETTFVFETTTKSSTTNKLKFCILNGMVVKNGGDVPDSDPCKLCSCYDGEVNCATQICAPPTGYENCTALPVSENVCCPKYSCQPKTEAVQFDDDDEGSQSNDSSLLTTTALPNDLEVSSEIIITTTGTVVGTASSDILDGNDLPSADEYKDEHKSSELDGGQVTLDSLGPGACLYDGKVYVSAQQIPRNNPCDFCFCFRGDIICLQQSCPPPIPGCREEIIDGFCCPRYECPVTMGFKNVTEQVNKPSLVSWLFGDESNSSQETVTTQVRGCEIQGDFHEVGAIVSSASGPCLQCRCGLNEKLECEPQLCEPQPLVKRMLTIRR